MDRLSKLLGFIDAIFLFRTMRRITFSNNIRKPAAAAATTAATAAGAAAAMPASTSSESPIDAPILDWLLDFVLSYEQLARLIDSVTFRLLMPLKLPH